MKSTEHYAEEKLIKLINTQKFRASLTEKTSESIEKYVHILLSCFRMVNIIHANVDRAPMSSWLVDLFDNDEQINKEEQI